MDLTDFGMIDKTKIHDEKIDNCEKHKQHLVEEGMNENEAKAESDMIFLKPDKYDLFVDNQFEKDYIKIETFLDRAEFDKFKELFRVSEYKGANFNGKLLISIIKLIEDGSLQVTKDGRSVEING